MSRTVNTHPVTPATRVLDAARVPYETLEYEHDAAQVSYGDEAAAKLGLDRAHVFKTLVLRLGAGSSADAFVVCVVPVASSADLKAAAAACGAKKAKLADAADVRRLTGYVLGGVSPLGMRTPLRTVVDAGARTLRTLYVSGGRRGFEVALAPADLVRLTGAVWADVGR